MPWPGEPIGNSVMPNSAAFADSASICRFEISSVTGPGVVGTLWSIVATVRSGRRTGRPCRRSPVERLGAGDLVHEVEVDVEQVGLALGAMDDVAFPDLLGERLR